MFRKKIVWLALFSLLPVPALAAEAQVLTDRAHYWHKLGRSDLAVLAWQELLVIEPDNAEARAGVAQIQVKNIPVENTQPESPPLPSPPAAKPAGVAHVEGIGPNYLDHAPLGLITEEPEVAGPGGALVTSDNPSRSELLERARYWDGRGRADLAAKVRNQYQLGEDMVSADKASSVSRKAVPDTQVTPVARAPEPEPVLAVAPASSPEEKAQYWQARGRNDLADKVRAPAEVKAPAVIVAVEPVTSAMPTASDSAKPQDKERQARYWQARGRSDLADKVRGSAAESSAAPVRTVTPMSISLSGAESVVAELPAMPPSRQVLSDGAQYWEMHGRNDLADQLRQKLQTMEPASGRAVYAGRGAAPERTLVSDKNINNNQYFAKSSLEDELLKNPNSLKARLDLAQIYRSAGEMAKARVLIDGVLASHPDLPEALYASAGLFAEQRLWPETLHVLEKISPAARTDEMAKLQKMAWAHVQIDRADALVRQGNNIEAELLLRQVAAELAVHANQTSLPEPPPLWKSAVTPRRKQKR